MATIALIAARYPTLSETFVRQDVENLRREGHEVRVVALRHGRLSHDSPDLCAYQTGWWITLWFSLLRYPLLFIGHLCAALKLMLTLGDATSLIDRLKLPIQAAAATRVAGWLARQDVDHIHAHFAHSPATFSLLMAGRLKVPFSFTGHANDLFARRALLKTKLRDAAFIACISRWHRDFYRSLVERDDDAYPIIHCGIDLQQFPACPPPRLEPPVTLITIARLVEKKGIDRLLEAFAELPAGQCELRVVGDGPARPRLEALSQRLGLDDRVVFLGPAAHSQVLNLLAESEIFVLPCRTTDGGDRDGIPVALMEAMATQRPVIAGDLPAIRELITHEETGLLVESNRPGAVSAAITRLINDPVSARDMARKGRKCIEETFSARTNGARLSAAIESAGGNA